MRKIKAYTIVEYNVNQGTREMETAINDLIAKGWQPYGSMTVAVHGDVFYAQPMVKYGEDK